MSKKPRNQYSYEDYEELLKCFDRKEESAIAALERRVRVEKILVLLFWAIVAVLVLLVVLLAMK